MKLRIGIIGCVGVPARYGGFETLAEAFVKNLAADHYLLNIYCQRSAYNKSERSPFINGHRRIFVPLKANGVTSILYDAVSLVDAVLRHRCSVVVCLGASGTILFPLMRLLCPWVSIIFNLDGLESRRAKWSLLGKIVLRSLEALGILFAHYVVSDNKVISMMVFHRYGRTSELIGYGGDHAKIKLMETFNINSNIESMPNDFMLAISRIVPENNVDLILKAFTESKELSLIYVGNWDSSNYGKSLRLQYGNHHKIKLFDPIYDADYLNYLRSKARGCIHGHSVGGTNPALVEAIFWAPKILAFDCGFNRATLRSEFNYWKNSDQLSKLLSNLDQLVSPSKSQIKQLQDDYSWSKILSKYSDLFKRHKL